jgi:uncharacterized protein with HEPN domain
VTSEDFRTFMNDVVASMEEALKYTANINQRNMVADYVEHFRYGE